MSAEKNVVARPTRVARRVGNIFMGVLASIVLTAAVFAVVVPQFVNAVPLTVLSGSMEPFMAPGDLLVSQKVDPKDVAIGDVVTFQPISGDPGLVTHRVIDIGVDVNAEFVFTTQGDANTAVDDPIVGDQVMGTYLYHIPYLGFVASFLGAKDKTIVIQVVGGLFILFALWFLFASARGRREASKAEGNAEAEVEPDPAVAADAEGRLSSTARVPAGSDLFTR